jgi:hypothetical protein
MAMLVTYFLKLIITSGILFLYYWAALRNRIFHNYNRFYLLAAVVISISIPFLNFKLYSLDQPIPVILNNFSVELNANNRVRQHFLFTWETFLGVTTIIISVSLLFILLSKIAWIYRMKRSHPVTRMNGFNLIETDLDQAPFSFLNNLFWRKSISMHDYYGTEIFAHELTHIKERHTYDKLFSQVMVCFFWMNPFYWLIQKELNVIHEFIADSKSIRDGDTESFAKMLLQSYNDGRFFNPSHSFFNSSIKRRLIMITTSKNANHSYLRRLLVLPILSVLVTVFSFSVIKAQSDPKLHPGLVNVQKVTMTKKDILFKNNDSLADVRIEYTKADGTAAVLNLTAKYANAKINNDPGKNEKAVLYNEESGEKKEITPKEVQQYVRQIIQSPPADFIYYVDGSETSSENIKMLDPIIIKTMNIFHHEEAVKKYGEKARNGVVAFTTK